MSSGPDPRHATFRPQPGERWSNRVAILLVLLLAGATAGLWWRQRPRERGAEEDAVVLPALTDDPGPGAEIVLEVNSRGVGQMEQYRYREAVRTFEEVVGRASGWLPARINLAIALFTEGTPDSHKRARRLFEAVLKQRPDNPHAHFCLGIMLLYEKDHRQAADHFEAVLRKDPDDAYSWYWLGTLREPDSPEQTRCFRRAHRLNPALAGPLYGLAMTFRWKAPGQARRLLTEYDTLRKAGWDTGVQLRYGEMGPYGEVISRGPRKPPAPTEPLPPFPRSRGFRVRLAGDARWARSADFGEGEAAEVRRLVRRRFGATVVVLDYDRDGRPDLFLAGAVVEEGQVRNLLLHNDGEGRFTDVTAEAGLAVPHPTLGCCVADLDNDGYPDLLLTGAGSQRLFRNTGKGRFEDATAAGALGRLNSVCLGAACVDLDQDSDLDLLLAEYAATPADALRRLRGQRGTAEGGLAVYLHTGEPGPGRSGQAAGPAGCVFERVPPECRWDRPNNLAALQGRGTPAVGVLASDLDGDRDLDLLALPEDAAPAAVLNDRVLRFRRRELPGYAGAWNGALVLDADHDGRSDILLVAAGQKPRLLVNRVRPGQDDTGRWFEEGAVASPPLIQAVAADMDLDGWADVVGLAGKRRPVLLHNRGGRLVEHPDAFGPDADCPGDLVAVTVLDADGDGFPDLLAWSESGGLLLHPSKGNRNRGLCLGLKGRNTFLGGGTRLRCNADGVGVWAEARAGDRWAGQEYTTLSAGLGQSRQPLLLGLGRSRKADLLRLRWPDGTRQAELDIPSGKPFPMEQSSYRIDW